MSLLVRAIRVLRRHGLWGLLFKCRAALADWQFDRIYGLDTGGIIPVSELSPVGSGRGHLYEGSRILVARRLLLEVTPLLPSRPVLVDVGSGKGRFLMVASEFPFLECRGIEFSPELCKIAERNVARFQQRSEHRIPITTTCADATRYQFSADENVIFLFNPFERELLEQVIGNLGRSLRDSPRELVICFLNVDQPAGLVSPIGCRELLGMDFWGYRLEVFGNQPRSSQG